MGAGRKPKPTAMKELEGNPGKRKLNKKEPIPGKGMPDCPKWLLPDAQEEGKRFFYLSNEGLSLVENAAYLGLPIPEKLHKVLEQLHDRSSEEKDGENDGK